MAHKPYPRSLYRLAEGGFSYEGRHFAMLTVESDQEEADAKKEGWVNHPDDCKDPLDHDGDGKKGGSEKGSASTAAKGAAKRKAVKRDAAK